MRRKPNAFQASMPAWLLAALLTACSGLGQAPPEPGVEPTSTAAVDAVEEQAAPTAETANETALASPAVAEAGVEKATTAVEPAPAEPMAATEATPAVADTATPAAEPAAEAGPTPQPAPPAQVAEESPVEAAAVAAQPEPAEVAKVEPPPDASTAPAEPAVAPAPPAEPKPAAPPLDLEGLETRLKKTKAIGLFTKLELKGEVDDLVSDVGDYHAGKGKFGIDELKEHFNLLVMKLLVLLQDDDPALGQDIARARPALWATLCDPQRFAKLQGA